MNKALEYILEKYPDHRHKIMALYAADEDFRALCEDYLISTTSLEEYRNIAIKDREVESEYTQVCIELDKEIIQVLGNDHKSAI